MSKGFQRHGCQRYIVYLYSGHPYIERSASAGLAGSAAASWCAFGRIAVFLAWRVCKAGIRSPQFHIRQGLRDWSPQSPVLQNTPLSEATVCRTGNCRAYALLTFPRTVYNTCNSFNASPRIFQDSENLRSLLEAIFKNQKKIMVSGGQVLDATLRRPLADEGQLTGCFGGRGKLAALASTNKQNTTTNFLNVKV